MCGVASQSRGSIPGAPWLAVARGGNSHRRFLSIGGYNSSGTENVILADMLKVCLGDTGSEETRQRTVVETTQAHRRDADGQSKLPSGFVKPEEVRSSGFHFSTSALLWISHCDQGNSSSHCGRHVVDVAGAVFTAFTVGNNTLDIFLIKHEFCCRIKHARHL